MKKLISIICCVGIIISLMVTLTACEIPKLQFDTNQSKQTTPAYGESDTNGTKGLSKEFKKAMDSYEEFIDEYVAFMKKVKENPNDMSVLSDYATYMSKYTEAVKDFEKWNNKELNDEELAYYIDVQARVSKKLLEATQ